MRKVKGNPRYGKQHSDSKLSWKIQERRNSKRIFDIYQFEFFNQVRVLVVGGSKGIGKACTELLLEQGCEVIVAARSNSEINHLPIEFIQLDVTKDLIELEDFDNLNGLIYCPGSINLKPFHRLSSEHFQQDLDVNLFGAIKTIQATLPALKKGNGSIVLFSTVAVSQGMTFHASVATSKGAIEGLTRSLASEYAPEIRVNAIAPSLTETPLAA